MVVEILKLLISIITISIVGGATYAIIVYITNEYNKVVTDMKSIKDRISSLEQKFMDDLK